MDAERLRAFLLTLPHVVETAQWGGLVFWVGDRALGGRMFVMLPLEAETSKSGEPRILSYPVGAERYNEMLEIDGLTPAPYLARIHWVAVRSWRTFRPAEWQAELTHAHQLTWDKLPARTRAHLGLPPAERKRLIAARHKLLAEKEALRKSKPRSSSPMSL